MGAMRKAGVWLGLVEDDEDRGYDDRSYRGYGDDFADEDEVDDAPAVTPRARLGDRSLADRSVADRTVADRSETGRPDRTVRSIARPASAVTYATRDNLALAPRTTVAERTCRFTRPSRQRTASWSATPIKAFSDSGRET